MITFDEKTGLFHIATEDMSYIIHSAKTFQGVYFGARVDDADMEMHIETRSPSSSDMDVGLEREEYAVWNGHSFAEPAVKIETANTNYGFMRYDSHRITGDNETETLEIKLIDELSQLEIDLYYILYLRSSIIAKRSVITAKKELSLKSAMSSVINLPMGEEFDVNYTIGRWAGEFQMQKQRLGIGTFVLQSRRGNPGFHANPTIALSSPGTTENSGNVWFGALGYSGNWAIKAEKTSFGNTHIVAGINDFNFNWNLKSGESFETPEFYIGFTCKGFGKMSRIMHDFQNKYILPERKLRRVVYNSWEATQFSVVVNEQKKLADRAAEMGCELFVLDDGWFGERHGENAGLGDWFVNKNKFPNGLSELVNYVNNLGMDFGIWLEPEAISPDSDLYRLHPDWVYRYKDYEPMLAREQLVLNITLKEVQDYLWNIVCDLLDNNNITFIKWDMNRSITDMGGTNDNGNSLWHRHVEALYSFWEKIRAHYPNVELETCSSGGGRIDLGIYRYADECWTSDNTDPLDRLFIQEGYTQFYAASAMMCWVTDTHSEEGWAKRSLKYRFHSSMCGGLGVGSDITKFSDNDMEESKKWIAKYKEIRNTVQNGKLYRLISPRNSNVSAVEYVAEDGSEAVTFVFQQTQIFAETVKPVKLMGLDKNSKYELKGSGKIYSGSTLMNAGIYPDIRGELDSTLIHFVKIK